MVATSVGRTVTGKGGNRIILDDPLNPRAGRLRHKRAATNEFFDKTLATRLDDKRRDAIVLVGHAVHDDDLTGHVLARSADWTVLKLPAIKDKPTTVSFPRTGRVFTREAGEPLWESREGLEQLAVMKRDLGSATWATHTNRSRPRPRAP